MTLLVKRKYVGSLAYWSKLGEYPDALSAHFALAQMMPRDQNVVRDRCGCFDVLDDNGNTIERWHVN